MKHFGKLFGLATAVALAMATPTFAKDKVVIGELSWTGGVAFATLILNLVVAAVLTPIFNAMAAPGIDETRASSNL